MFRPLYDRIRHVRHLTEFEFRIPKNLPGGVPVASTGSSLSLPDYRASIQQENFSRASKSAVCQSAGCARAESDKRGERHSRRRHGGRHRRHLHHRRHRRHLRHSRHLRRHLRHLRHSRYRASRPGPESVPSRPPPWPFPALLTSPLVRPQPSTPIPSIECR